MNKKQKIFTEIYKKYINKIYRFVFLRVNSEEKAQDLCSETFLRVWEIFNNKERKIDNYQSFLYQTARNLIIDFYRKRGRTQIVPIEELNISDPTQDLEDKTIINSDIKEVQTILTTLKQDYQDIIIWYYIEELSISEISQILNKSEGATRVMLHRALNALRNKIQKS